MAPVDIGAGASIQSWSPAVPASKQLFLNLPEVNHHPALTTKGISARIRAEKKKEFHLGPFPGVFLYSRCVALCFLLSIFVVTSGALALRRQALSRSFVHCEKESQGRYPRNPFPAAFCTYELPIEGELELELSPFA
jgi:hypothetical protein